MKTPEEEYDQRAAAAQAEADAATLPNVRDRALRSAQSWAELARRTRRAKPGRGAQPTDVSE
jgi:hypothetical protein